MKKSQAFSVDFLIAVAVLTLALGIFLNSYSQIQKSSISTLNSSAFVIAEGYYQTLSQGGSVGGCLAVGDNVTVCDFCAGGANKFFVQRLYSYGGKAKILRVGVCE